MAQKNVIAFMSGRKLSCTKKTQFSFTTEFKGRLLATEGPLLGTTPQLSATYQALASQVELAVAGVDDELAGLLVPADDVSTGGDLNQRVQAALQVINVGRDLSRPHLVDGVASQVRSGHRCWPRPAPPAPGSRCGESGQVRSSMLAET